MSFFRKKLFAMNIYKKGRPYFLSPLRKIIFKKLVIKSSNPFSSNLFVFANHSDVVSKRPRTMVTPQFVKKQVIMLQV